MWWIRHTGLFGPVRAHLVKLRFWKLEWYIGLQIGCKSHIDVWLHGLGQRFRYNISRMELIKLQKLPCLAITGVMKMTSAAAMEVLLELSPLHVMIEEEDQAEIYGLMCTQQWKLKSTNFGHVKNLRTWSIKPSYRCGPTGWYRAMHTTCCLWSSSLTSVNGRTCLNHILKGPGLAHRRVQDQWMKRSHSFSLRLHTTYSRLNICH